MLRYPKGPSPKVLTSWQATPSADWSSVPAADKDQVRASLLRDQGHLCAYCERRISAKDGRMKVEHRQAQSTGAGSLRWKNLLGVCLGDERAETGAPEGEQHCDTARGDASLFLHPVEGEGPSPRDHLAYTSEGKARPSLHGSTESVQRDIDSLHLNAERLVRARRIVHDEVRRRLEKKAWSTKALRDEYRAATLQPGVQAPEQCEVVRYYLLRWARGTRTSLEP